MSHVAGWMVSMPLIILFVLMLWVATGLNEEPDTDERDREMTDYSGPDCPHDPLCANRGECFGRKFDPPCGHLSCGPANYWIHCIKDDDDDWEE